MKPSYSLPLLLLLVACLTFSCKDEETTYTCVDKMGHSYKTVVIGDQVWMAENLVNKKVNEYDRDDLQNTVETRDYQFRDFAQYSHFDDNPNYYNYGYIYNYYAAIEERLIPEGWRLPTKADWEKLSNYIKSHSPYDSTNWVAKALSSKFNWTASNIPGAIGYDRPTNDKYGFNIIPAGYRNEHGAFYYENKSTCFWTSTVDSVTTNLNVAYFTYTGVGIEWLTTMDKSKSGAYIRCVRDL